MATKILTVADASGDLVLKSSLALDGLSVEGASSLKGMSLTNGASITGTATVDGRLEHVKADGRKTFFGGEYGENTITGFTYFEDGLGVKQGILHADDGIRVKAKGSGKGICFEDGDEWNCIDNDMLKEIKAAALAVNGIPHLKNKVEENLCCLDNGTRRHVCLPPGDYGLGDVADMNNQTRSVSCRSGAQMRLFDGNFSGETCDVQPGGTTCTGGMRSTTSAGTVRVRLVGDDLGRA
jgi:hypothetical protein